jgi:hypothetical protein
MFLTMIPVNSSAIRAVDYDGNHLLVQFHSSDTIYDHPNVPYDVYEAFINADSPGTYYNQHIRGRYR